ncbi:MAG: alpha/beta hydrolase [Alphaproteobacteria bacterium]
MPKIGTTGSDAGPRILTRQSDGAAIACVAVPGTAPTVVFLPGFRSDMGGAKALALESWCRARGQAFMRFDYTGHGQSSGTLTGGTIGQWAADAIFAIERATEGPLVLVGSSMGGWIMLLAARALPARVEGMVGIAAAPDFTEDLIWKNLGEAGRQKLAREGVLYQPSEYDDEPTPITLALIEDGREQLVLRGPLAFDGPMRLIHGMKDGDVPWRTAQRIAERVTSADVELILVKGGEHRLSAPGDLARLTRHVGEVCAIVAARG